MEHGHDVIPGVDGTIVSVTSSLCGIQTLLNDDSDVHEGGHTVLHESVQTISHDRVVSNGVHKRLIPIHGESTRVRAATVVLVANMDAKKEAGEKEDKHREC